MQLGLNRYPFVTHSLLFFATITHMTILNTTFRRRLTRATGVFLALIPLAIHAGEYQFSSRETQTTVIELYTSEGCSSCPPADAWLSRQKQAPELWTQLIPLAFHVDYWNYLGWRDPLSKSEYSARQRRYATLGRAGTVYTPGFFQNGSEWRGWFRRQEVVLPNPTVIGKLTVKMSGDAITASYLPAQPQRDPLQFYYADLGFAVENKIQAGENAGRTLVHDFVVISLMPSLATLPDANDNIYHWRIQHLTINDRADSIRAMAFWVAYPGNPAPIQATGGWLALP